jgi:hypothetical protein
LELTGLLGVDAKEDPTFKLLFPLDLFTLFSLGLIDNLHGSFFLGPAYLFLDRTG